MNSQTSWTHEIYSGRQYLRKRTHSQSVKRSLLGYSQTTSSHLSCVLTASSSLGSWAETRPVGKLRLTQLLLQKTFITNLTNESDEEDEEEKFHFAVDFYPKSFNQTRKNFADWRYFCFFRFFYSEKQLEISLWSLQMRSLKTEFVECFVADKLMEKAFWKLN